MNQRFPKSVRSHTKPVTAAGGDRRQQGDLEWRQRVCLETPLNLRGLSKPPREEVT